MKVVGSPGNNDQAFTDANGNYKIECVQPAGSKSLLAEATSQGYAPGVANGVGVPASGSVTQNFSLHRLPVTRVLQVWNTGVDATRAKLPPSSVEPHWVLVAGPGITGPRSPFVVSDQHPGGQYFAAADSMWIGPDVSGAAIGGSPYTYRLSFDLTGFVPASVKINGAWCVDNDGQITINGGPPVGTGTLSLTGAAFGNFNATHTFEITGGFVAGINSLEILVTNFGAGGDPSNPSGLNVTGLTISGTPTP